MFLSHNMLTHQALSSAESTGTPHTYQTRTLVCDAEATIPTAPVSCASFPEFLAFIQTVTDSCCTTGVECPPGGIPTRCTAACAAVLLPMQELCAGTHHLALHQWLPRKPDWHVRLAADFLRMNGMSATVDAAAASCPLQCPEDRRPMDTRPAECKAADIDDETKAALCQSECLLASTWTTVAYKH